jgi:RNA polymerase sigma-70 factor, ECF subfamily
VSDEATFQRHLAAARTGDNAAMTVLFREHHPRLSRFVRAAEPRAADDLLGEVWLAVAGGLHTFDGDAQAFRAWIFAIARRRIADHRRRGVRRKTEPASEEVFGHVPALDDAERTALENLSGQDAAALVAAVLPPEQAEVILLRVLGDLATEDVARLLGRSTNWVRVTQHRGLRRLVERFGNEIDVTNDPPPAMPHT